MLHFPHIARDYELRISLNIQVSHVQCVVFDELAARLDHVAHQNRKHLVGLDSVVFVQIDLEQFAFFRIHRGLEQFLGIHFAETFEALDLHPATPDLQNLVQDFGNGKKRIRNRAIPFAFDQFKNRPIARRVMINLQPFAGELGDDLLDGGGFVQLDQLAARRPVPFVFAGASAAKAPAAYPCRKD